MRGALTLAAALGAALPTLAAGGEAPAARDVVVQALKAHVADVSACYRAAVTRKPWLEGRLLVSLGVSAAGEVERVEIERTDVNDARFLGCVVDALHAVRLATPIAGAVDLSYPFELGGGTHDASVLVDGRARPTVPPARCHEAKECRELGASYAFGDEGERRRAFEYFAAGCDLDDGASCAGAAAALDVGRGVAKDRARAFKLAGKACARGAHRACTSVAMSHVLGLADAKGATVATRDAAKGSALLARECDAKEPVACLALAERVRLGLGVARDETRAATLRARALALDP